MSDGYVGLFKTRHIELPAPESGPPPQPEDVILTSGSRFLVGKIPIMGELYASWQCRHDSNISGFEVRLIESGQSLTDTQPVFVSPDGKFTAKPGTVGYGIVKFGQEITGIRISNLKPNTSYVCAVRTIGINGKNSSWVLSQAISTGSPAIPAISNLSYNITYKGLELSWDEVLDASGKSHVEYVDIKVDYIPFGGSTQTYLVKNHKSSKIFIDFPRKTTIDEIRVTPYSIDGNSGMELVANPSLPNSIPEVDLGDAFKIDTDGSISTKAGSVKIVDAADNTVKASIKDISGNVLLDITNKALKTAGGQTLFTLGDVDGRTTANADIVLGTGKIKTSETNPHSEMSSLDGFVAFDTNGVKRLQIKDNTIEFFDNTGTSAGTVFGNISGNEKVIYFIGKTLHSSGFVVNAGANIDFYINQNSEKVVFENKGALPGISAFTLDLSNNDPLLKIKDNINGEVQLGVTSVSGSPYFLFKDPAVMPNLQLNHNTSPSITTPSGKPLQITPSTDLVINAGNNAVINNSIINKSILKPILIVVGSQTNDGATITVKLRDYSGNIPPGNLFGSTVRGFFHFWIANPSATVKTPVDIVNADPVSVDSPAGLVSVISGVSGLGKTYAAITNSSGDAVIRINTKETTNLSSFLVCVEYQGFVYQSSTFNINTGTPV
jgi:hypothetical protein